MLIFPSSLYNLNAKQLLVYLHRFSASTLTSHKLFLEFVKAFMVSPNLTETSCFFVICLMNFSCPAGTVLFFYTWFTTFEALFEIMRYWCVLVVILSLMFLISGGSIRLFHDFLIIITWLATSKKLEKHTVHSSGDSFITVTYIPFDIERSKLHLYLWKWNYYRGLFSFDRCESIDWHRKWTDVARSKWCWKRSCQVLAFLLLYHLIIKLSSDCSEGHNSYTVTVHLSYIDMELNEVWWTIF